MAIDKDLLDQLLAGRDAREFSQTRRQQGALAGYFLPQKLVSKASKAAKPILASTARYMVFKAAAISFLSFQDAKFILFRGR